MSYDTDESQFNSLEIELKASQSPLFGYQYHWEVRSDTPDTSSFQNGVLFWVINETQLSRICFRERLNGRTAGVEHLLARLCVNHRSVRHRADHSGNLFPWVPRS